MRQEFIQVDSRYKAKKEAKWASKVTKVNGGYIAFESVQEFETWKKQK